MNNNEQQEYRKALIKQMQEDGATFIKSDYFDAFFDVEIGSNIDDNEKLKIAKLYIRKYFGLGLKIRKCKK